MTPTMTRQEHLDWCKRRALAYLPAKPQEAMTSMLSDLEKHPETKDHIGIMLGMTLVMNGLYKTPEEIRRFINGFN